MKKYQDIVNEIYKKYVKVKPQYYQEFLDWCQELNITCVDDGTTFQSRQAYTIWYIENDEHRVWATLRWSEV